MPKTRNYNCKDVDMLMASKIIMESFMLNLPELSTIRTNWTEQYASELTIKIDEAIEDYLGLDSKKKLREATANLHSIQNPAKRDLSFLKTQIDDDFKDNARKKNEILKRLGITRYLHSVQNHDQEALIQLLYVFKRNMNSYMKRQITSKGMSPALIERIMDYASSMKHADKIQELLKKTTKNISSDVIIKFNTIYSEIIGICKIAANYYRYESLKKEQFTFSRAVKNMNAIKKTD